MSDHESTCQRHRTRVSALDTNSHPRAHTHGQQDNRDDDDENEQQAQHSPTGFSLVRMRFRELHTRTSRVLSHVPNVCLDIVYRMARQRARSSAEIVQPSAVCGHTNHRLLLADDLAQILEDLIQFCNPLLDLLNLALSFLNQLLLKLDFCIRNAFNELLLLSAWRTGSRDRRLP